MDTFKYLPLMLKSTPFVLFSQNLIEMRWSFSSSFVRIGQRRWFFTNSQFFECFLLFVTQTLKWTIYMFKHHFCKDVWNLNVDFFLSDQFFCDRRFQGHSWKEYQVTTKFSNSSLSTVPRSGSLTLKSCAESNQSDF